MYVNEMKKTGGLFSFKIELQGAYDDAETKKELCDPETEEPYYFEFRELTGDEFREVVKLEDKDQLAFLEKKVSDCLMSHNLRDDTRTIVSNADAIAAARQYGSLFYYIVEQWQESIPLLKRSTERSKK